MRIAQEHPPRPGTGLVIGITGHRRLDGAAVPAIEAALATLFETVAREAAAVLPDGARPPLVLSQLATGADQLAANAGLAAGFALGAILPFDRAAYEASFATAERAAFRELFAHVGKQWWQLPDVPEDRERGYLLAGDAMIGEADVIVALWDGRAANGLGGTADVVESAVRRGVPVVHVPVAAPQEMRLLWAGLSGLSPALLRRQTAPRAPLSAELLRSVLKAQVAPPEAPTERAALDRFLAERDHRWRPRIEYPLLLALTGVRRLRLSALRTPSPPRPSEASQAALLDGAFSWADRLADHYGELYRGSAIFNYVAAAGAVLLALVGILLPHAKLPLLLGELGVTVALIVNTSLGNRQDWHQRWLDYRYLAETLRPLRSLKCASIAGRLGGTRGQPAAERWMDWYAGAIWRAVGLPPSLDEPGAVAALGSRILRDDVAPQIAYHRASAHRMHRLDHRLHQFGTVLFVIVGVLGLASLAGYALHAEFDPTTGKLITVLGAGLPTIGAACFGIRGQLDLVGTAARSEQTAAALEPSARQLAGADGDLLAVAQAIDAAAAVMLQDLADWRVSYRERRLAIPS